MGLRGLVTGHRFYQYTYILVGVVALSLFMLSFLVEVRIIIERPSYGEVTSVASTLWQAILGLTTIGAFILAIYTYRTDVDDSEGPAMGFTIRGQNHDIDVHLHVENDGIKSKSESEDHMGREETGRGDEGTSDQNSS